MLIVLLNLISVLVAFNKINIARINFQKENVHHTFEEIIQEEIIEQIQNTKVN